MAKPFQVVHLDANGLVSVSDPSHRLALRVARWLAAGVELHTSAMAWAEFQNGPPGGLPPTEDEAARTVVSHVLPVGQAEAELAARLFNATGRRSRSLPDCLVAACAILARAPLATHNDDDFGVFRPHGLSLA